MPKNKTSTSLSVLFLSVLLALAGCAERQAREGAAEGCVDGAEYGLVDGERHAVECEVYDDSREIPPFAILFRTQAFEEAYNAEWLRCYQQSYYEAYWAADNIACFEDSGL